MKTMDAILKAFLSDLTALQSRRVEQIVAICGNGTLSDGSECSENFRGFLKNVPSKILKKYSEECLDGTQSRNQNSGLILQDIVNEVGERLGFSVEAGYYRGAQSRIGNDGLWSSNGFAFVIEVKTSDLSIKLDKIADYRRYLIAESPIKEKSSSVLIVLGRQDTGDLEAQIRGSKHAWDMRMIGIDSLFRLLELKENLNDPASIIQITELLKPIEYTRVDKLIDVVFFTSSDISTNEDSEIPEDISLQVPSNEITHDLKVEAEPRTHSSPVNFYEECVARINLKLGKNLIKNGRVTYTSSDKSTNIVLLNSKAYIAPNGQSFWYGFRPNQNEFLEQKQQSYIAFGCGSKDLVILIPFLVFKPWPSKMATTFNEDGSLQHRHVYIEKSGMEYLLRVGDEYKNITEYVLKDGSNC